MSRASDITPRTMRWNVGLCGEAGCGKSTMASTFPGLKMVFEFDDKPAAYQGTDTIYHTFHPVDDDFRSLKLLMQDIIDKKGNMNIAPDGELFNEYGYPLEDGEIVHPKCYILDSITGMEKLTMAQAMTDDQRSKSPAEGPAEHHYLYTMQRTGQILDLFRMLPGSRVITFHFEVMEVRRKGAVVETNRWPLMIGKTRFRMRKEFGEWYHFTVEQGEERPEHRIITHAPDEMTAFTTLGFDKIDKVPILDVMEEPSFPHLIEKIEDYWEAK